MTECRTCRGDYDGARERCPACGMLHFDERVRARAQYGTRRLSEVEDGYGARLDGSADAFFVAPTREAAVALLVRHERQKRAQPSVERPAYEPSQTVVVDDGVFKLKGSPVPWTARVAPTRKQIADKAKRLQEGATCGATIRLFDDTLLHATWHPRDGGRGFFDVETDDGSAGACDATLEGALQKCLNMM